MGHIQETRAEGRRANSDHHSDGYYGVSPNLLNLEQLRNRRDLVDVIDWEMTPETAIEAFLEWGTGWSRRETSLRYALGEAYYFVIYDWEEPPQVTLLRRDSQSAEELAKIVAPPELVRQSVFDAGRKPGVGVCSPNDDLREWLRTALRA